MGHVDHGKTRLLDTIRKANVREGEAGGITQHIGAYQVLTELDGNERLVTFIDTPGHEAFTAMRARGAKATDIAILVVAADDGVMPQTVEAINHAQAADVPIVVAVNKIDKEGADPAKIRAQLTEYNLVAEDFGGDTMFVDISAKQGTNIDALLEAVLLTADAALDLRANPDMEAQGVAIEAHLDRGRGPVATVLIQRGTLRVGDSIVAGDAYGRVRRMVDEHGEDVEEALPSRPVQVIGFTSVPGAGDNLLVVDEDRIARQIADRRSARKRNALAARTRKRISLDDLDAALKETCQLNLILKGDNSGTVEALEEALLGIEIDDEVELRVIDRGVGGVTETNVNLASASDAIIIGFNVRAEGKATELANREGVDIRYYSVIYQAIDEIQSALKGMLKPVYEEKELGRAEIRAIFRSSKVGNIAGCLVTSGIIRRNAKARLLRDNVVVAETVTISSLQAGEGRRHRGARRLRMWSDPDLLRHQGRRRHRGVRTRGEGARVMTTSACAKSIMVDVGRARRCPSASARSSPRRSSSRSRIPAGLRDHHGHEGDGDLHDATAFYTVRGRRCRTNRTTRVPRRRWSGPRACCAPRSVRPPACASRRRWLSCWTRSPTPPQHMEELLARARAADEDLARVRQGAKPAGDADPYRVSGAGGSQRGPMELATVRR